MRLLSLAIALGVALSAQPASKTDLARWQQQVATISIVRDDWGIAHVHGKTDADAVFGMIYAQALLSNGVCAAQASHRVIAFKIGPGLPFHVWYTVLSAFKVSLRRESPPRFISVYLSGLAVRRRRTADSVPPLHPHQ